MAGAGLTMVTRYLPLYSTYQLRLENGGSLPFITAYLNTFVVTNIFNLFDAVVLDLIILAFMMGESTGDSSAARARVPGRPAPPALPSRRNC